MKGKRHEATCIIATAMLVTSPALAGALAFVGIRASDQSCHAHDSIDFGPEAVQSDYLFCEYEAVEEVSPGQRNVASQCLYESDGAHRNTRQNSTFRVHQIQCEEAHNLPELRFTDLGMTKIPIL